jgi:hypothetical protein
LSTFRTFRQEHLINTTNQHIYPNKQTLSSILLSVISILLFSRVSGMKIGTIRHRRKHLPKHNNCFTKVRIYLTYPFRKFYTYMIKNEMTYERAQTRCRASGHHQSNKCSILYTFNIQKLAPTALGGRSLSSSYIESSFLHHHASCLS